MTMITPSYLGETIEYSSLHACRSTLEDPTERRVYAAFETGIGYVQCRPQSSPPAIYCEAQSAESWPALASVLTPARVERLHAAGFTDPGRGPNYGKLYRLDQADDAAIGSELLTVLHDVYGYTGVPQLKVVTEEARR